MKIKVCFCENTPQSRHSAAWRLLYEMVEQEYGLSRDEIIVDVTPYGKPYFSSHPQLHFSLSHGENCAVCVLSERMIGVDVEKIRAISPRLKVCRLGLTADSDDTTALRRWTAMESYGKLIGSGVGKRTWREMMEEAEGKCSFLDMSTLLNDDYVMTVCYQK